MIHQLEPKDCFVARFSESVKKYWDCPAVTMYRGESLTYGALAAEIEKTLLFFRAAGLEKGDKVAINARSSIRWATVFMAAQIGGYVAVQIFKGFTPHDTAGLINHSDARILFTEKQIFSKMSFDALPNLLAAVDTNTAELLASRSGAGDIYNNREALYAAKYPDGFSVSDIDYACAGTDTLAAIMYTSGSTGNPKGVMLTCGNFSANIYAIERHFPYRGGENYVSVLPYSHIFGLTYDMLMPLCLGMHLVILGIPPAPANLIPAMQQYRPHVFLAVPLVLEKLVEATVGRSYKNVTPEQAEAYKQALGGEVELYATGGAAIDENLEKLLVKKMKVPFITGYGMSEAAPTICLGQYGDYRLRECGKVLDEILELKIDSADGAGIPGEILIKGPAVFKGYYKNEEATARAFTADGWFRTGDLATLEDGCRVFIVGRCKNMILGSNGQNIFPEEIEVILNSLPYVAESIIIEKASRLFAIVVPKSNDVANDNLSAKSLLGIMQKNIRHLNSRIPAYSAVSGFRIQYEPFAKTPKGTIKRFMYTE
jgi:long-chain acyl-CoA synthetase